MKMCERFLTVPAGHRQLGTTQRYIEVTPEQKRKAVELVS